MTSLSSTHAREFIPVTPSPAQKRQCLKEAVLGSHGAHSSHFQLPSASAAKVHKLGVDMKHSLLRR